MATKKTTRKSTSSKRTRTNTTSKRRTKEEYLIIRDIKVILLIALSILLFFCNFNMIGKFGELVSNFFFGLFGTSQYFLPLALGLVAIFSVVNKGDRKAAVKVVAALVLLLLICMVFELIGGIYGNISKFSLEDLYNYAKTERRGGGLLAASIVYALSSLIGKVGVILLIIFLGLICILLVTEIRITDSVRRVNENYRRAHEEDEEINRELIEERRERRKQRNEELRLRQEELNQKAIERRNEKLEIKERKEDEKVLERNRKVTGVTLDTKLMPETKPESKDEMHEITLDGFDPVNNSFDINAVPINGIDEQPEIIHYEPDNQKIEAPVKKTSTRTPKALEPEPVPSESATLDVGVSTKKPTGSCKYVFPPISLLTENKSNEKKGTAQEIRQTALKLQQTLETFGVRATVTDISQGPTVTRFELQPETGVKVSKIKSLADDIKLNLAASDIRIEAPIPGKAAIGIEVPNKDNQSVLLRDLIETADFKNAKDDLTFAVGKDIAGKVVLYTVDSFPHLLIAGATGSGKSVCINTLIMSIIYKAHPDDVKLVMIDPKVVELSVYNGIPHLLCPVVTDCKKAAATLNFAVNEMMERYKKFEDMGVRDLKGYNEAVKDMNDELHKKLPRIVIIVDELADLMMVAKNDVEVAISRLTALARAAGIYLVVATQRPSVDVITGLIKANMPSRLAFAVSSNTDSRTILDMGGAEELLGKGDMLFFPKGYKKPVRLQGAFISDKEINDIVKFLKDQGITNVDPEIDKKIESCKVSSNEGGGLGDSSDSSVDDMFIEAGRFVIESNNASIGWLQRKFKMGFNRAARVMDQLADAGVVSQSEGTKSRQVLMSMEQFENYIENEL